MTEDEKLLARAADGDGLSQEFAALLEERDKLKAILKKLRLAGVWPEFYWEVEEALNPTNQ